MPERNGERSRLPVSGLRRKPSTGTVPHRRAAPNTAVATAAKRRPRRSWSDSSSMAVDCSSPFVVAEPRDDDALGHPGAGGGDDECRHHHEEVVGGGVDDVPRLDDLGGLLGQPGQQRIDRAEQQIRAVAARDPCERRGQARQWGAFRRRGRLSRRGGPAARSRSRSRCWRALPTGRSRTSAAASARRAPAGGSTAAMRPLASITPMPSIETSTVPSGAKLVKLVTISTRMRCRPATVSRLIGCMVSPVRGWIASRPVRAAIPETTMITPARMANSVPGCGRALPPRSTAVRKTDVQLFSADRRKRIAMVSVLSYGNLEPSRPSSSHANSSSPRPSTGSRESQRRVAAAVGVDVAPSARFPLL